ncbi:MAG: cupin domain-containing protein [Wenzhouxiangellaceae bacterium]|nr:cupin domain-containing protein [Wenzhouxiangellaceae bacterium]
MSRLTVYPDTDPTHPEFRSEDHAEIAGWLAPEGVRFERWHATREIAPDEPHEAILSAYAEDIERLKNEGGYVTVDVVNMWPDHPQREQARKKFLDEHRHAEDEVRFFVNGRGLFSLHLGEKVYEVLCERGDLISVPAGTPHWFDMGPRPEFTAIRLFNNPEGWVAQFTGSDIAGRFPRLDG